MIQRVNVTGIPQLSLNIGGTIVQANYSSGSGTNTLKFTYTIISGLNDANGISINANSLSLNGGTIKDFAGNNLISTHNNVIDNISYKVDTTPPVAPSLSLATDSGSSASDGITNVSTINVGGLETGASWQYSMDGGAWTNGSSTSFNASLGSHTYYVRQTDLAGNLGSSSAGIAYNYDTTPPVAPSLSLATDSGSSSTDGITNISTINVGGLEIGASWQYSVDGSAWANGSGASFTATTGSHVYYVRQTDKAGNIGVSSTGVTYNLDTIAPATLGLGLAIDSGSSSSDKITNASTINVSGLESGASWQYSVDGGAWTNGSGSSFAATAGTHTYYVRQTDIAGNTGGQSGDTYTLDQSISTPSISSIYDNVGSSTGTISNGGTTDDTTLSISGVAEANSMVTVYMGGSVLGTVSADSSGGWSVTTTTLSDGAYNFSVLATDTAGNVSSLSSTYSVTVSTYTPPTAGQSVIDLGTNGNLILPIQVEGKWYYIWDFNGDNVVNDAFSIDSLSTYFNNDINGNVGASINNTYRYLDLSSFGVKLAIPTYGDVASENLFNANTISATATAVSNNTITDNPTYNDLLAIWDSTNGTATGTLSAYGYPTGWKVGPYMSSTPTYNGGHAFVSMGFGYIQNSPDSSGAYLEVEVII